MSDTLPGVSPQFNAELQALFARQQAHQFVVGRTTARERVVKLKRLYQAVLKRRQAIRDAVWADLHKGVTEADFSELGVILGEIRHAIRHLRSWMAPREVENSLVLFGTRSVIRHEPKGVCLIMAPWNFPFNLTLTPVVSAVAAGCCAIVKPSEFTPHSAALMREIIADCFPPEEIALVEGDVPVAQALLELPFNHIYFVGSPVVGKIVMAAAARHLASVTLELGGMDPVIVDETADLDMAASRIAWLKAMNGGQSCIGVNYVMAHASIHDRLAEKVKVKLEQYYGATEAERRRTPDLCRLVNERHFDRVNGILQDAVQKGARVVCGGGTNRDERFIDPTLLADVPDDAVIWNEEVFGPVMAIRPFNRLEDAIAYINARPRPLCIYIFSKKRDNVETVLRETRNGGVTVNDCGLHFYNFNLPFGGVNNSGIGKGHGYYSFLEFTNQRAVLYQNRIFPNTNLFLPPYGSRLARWLMEGVVKWF